MTVDRERLKQRLQNVGETPERAALLAGVLAEELGGDAPPEPSPPAGPGPAAPSQSSAQQRPRPTSVPGRGRAEAEKRFGDSRPVASADTRGVVWTGRR